MSAWGREERKNREIVKPLTLRMVQSDRSETLKQIVDIKQSKTEPPKQSAIFAAEDHAAVREQRTKNRPANAAESNGSGFSRPSPGSLVGRKKNESKSSGGRSPRLVVDPGGRVRALGKAQTTYEALLREQVAASRGSSGMRSEHLDERIAEGDRIDLNTTNYKYISYFIGVRKAIELTWVYPSAAVRSGLQGEVRLEFKIEKDGRMTKIRILNSSGYEVLDNAIVEAIRLAAPFAPLPKSMAKNDLVVTATFRYVLYARASGSRFWWNTV